MAQQGLQLKRTIILFLLRALARASHARFFERVDLKAAFEQVSEDGIVVNAHGFVFDSGDFVSGVYLVDYNIDILENRYGRYN